MRVAPSAPALPEEPRLPEELCSGNLRMFCKGTGVFAFYLKITTWDR